MQPSDVRSLSSITPNTDHAHHETNTTDDRANTLHSPFTLHFQLDFFAIDHFFADGAFALVTRRSRRMLPAHLDEARLACL